MLKSHYFIWNNKNSFDFGIIIQSATPHNKPDYDREFVSVPGRNGGYVKSNKRFNNVKITYSCAVLQSNNFNSYHEQIEQIASWLHESSQASSYCKLEDSYNPNKYRLALLKEALELDRDNAIYTFGVVFDCQPQLYLTAGDNWLDFSTEALTLINPSNYTAQPKIVISGNTSTTTLSDTLTVDNVSYSFKSWTGQSSLNGKNYLNDIILDAEIMDCYLSDGTPCNRYLLTNNTSPDRFIELGKGSHTISHTGNCTVIIQPRWWTI